MKTKIKHLWYDVKRKIEYFFFPSRNRMSKQSRLNRRVANIIKDYFDDKLTTSAYALQMTKVIVKEHKENIKVTVELCRPGLLIGKGGQTIDAVNARLVDYFDKPVFIHIKESYLF